MNGCKRSPNRTDAAGVSVVSDLVQTPVADFTAVAAQTPHKGFAGALTRDRVTTRTVRPNGVAVTILCREKQHTQKKKSVLLLLQKLAEYIKMKRKAILNYSLYLTLWKLFYCFIDM